MIISTHTLRRLCGAAALATCVACLAVPAALAGGNSGYQDGWYGYAVALTKASHSKSSGSKLIDGRSPDTKDAALAVSRFGAPDGWYPYVLSLTKANAPTLIDGRSPDTRDAAASPLAIGVTTGVATSFQWGDFAIGIGVAVCSMLLLLGSALAVRTTRRPNKTRSTATA